MVAVLEGNAYGKAIASGFDEKLARKVSLSAVHITLYRLEDKGLVTSDLGGATAKRGGRRKRLFTITNSGRELLENMRDQRQKLWQFMPGLKFSIY